MAEDNSDNKVVQFPIHKVKRSQNETPSTLDQGVHPQRRASLVISLVATVFLATFITNQLNQQQKAATSSVGADGRGLASADSEGASPRELQEDILLARKIARESLREPASRGREPSAEDLLRHGELAGLYTMSFSDVGALSSIEFNSTAGSERYITHRDEFLKRNLDLLRIPASEVALSESLTEGPYQFEVYELKQGDKVTARVHFKVDAQDHLYSMKVESIK